MTNERSGCYNACCDANRHDYAFHGLTIKPAMTTTDPMEETNHVIGGDALGGGNRGDAGQVEQLDRYRQLLWSWMRRSI